MLGAASDERKQHLIPRRIARHVIVRTRTKRQSRPAAAVHALDGWPMTPRFRAIGLDAEFPADDDPDGINRRRWLQLMGASLALAGVPAAAAGRSGKFVPLPSGPADRMPGEPSDSPRRWTWAARVLGLVVTCVDGRPIKIEGNPEHPQSLGATNAFAQAAILELYDPDRSKERDRKADRRREEVRSWEEFADVCPRAFSAIAEEERRRGIARAFRGQQFADACGDAIASC